MLGLEFQESVISNNANEGFGELIEKVLNDETYDGSILTCDLGECTLSFDRYLKSNEKKAQIHIEKLNYGSECVADYIDLGIVQYQVLTIKKNKEKLSSKAKLKYTIEKLDGENFVKTPYSYEKYIDAKEKAIKLICESSGVKFIITKDYEFPNNDNVCTEFEIKRQNFNNKPIKNLKPNQFLIEKHKYIFYGIAMN